MSTQPGAVIHRKGYVYEIQYHELGEQGSPGGAKHPYRTYTPYTRKVFGPWPDPRPAIKALESLVVEQSRKRADETIAEYGSAESTHVLLIHAIEVASVARVMAVDDIFGFDFAPLYSPAQPTSVGVAP